MLIGGDDDDDSMLMREGEPQQQAPGQLQSKSELRELVSIFPPEELVYAFGYGSGVFVQHQSDNKNAKMIDLILVVKDSKAFHERNLEKNPHHYNTFQNASWVNWLQRHELDAYDVLLRNPKVYFNLVSEPWMKYGVVQLDDLESDLCHWDSLYLAGRMHKPIVPIKVEKDGDHYPRHHHDLIESWQQDYNLPAAWSLAMLLISSNADDDKTTTTTTTTSWEQLYHSIAQLSYTGDIRMQMGAEDPKKVSKLVESPGQLERFHDLYHPSLEKSYKQGTNSAILEMTPNEITWESPLLWKNLPPRLEPLQSPFTKAAATPNQRQTLLLKALQSIVAPAARYQSFKGIFTAGLIKSAQYAGAKLSKGILRRK